MTRVFLELWEPVQVGALSSSFFSLRANLPFPHRDTSGAAVGWRACRTGKKQGEGGGGGGIGIFEFGSEQVKILEIFIGTVCIKTGGQQPDWKEPSEH